MRGDLPKKEPEILARWERIGLWRRLREASANRPKFILHDGPPYANGNLHIGTALNKILKDVVNRARQMAGYDADYIPGWDCHGLPIEWRIEEEYRKSGRDKDAVPLLQFRAECRAYASALDGGAEAGVPPPRRRGRLGRALRHDGLSFGGRHRGRDRQVFAQSRAVPGAAARALEPGREDGARRGRGRVPRPHQHNDLGALSCLGVPDRGGGRGLGCDLDHDALDHPGQPGARRGG